MHAIRPRHVLAAAAILACVPAAALGARPAFDSGRASVDLDQNGPEPFIALGDVDEDGIPDLIAPAGDFVQVRWGQGDGGFGGPASFPVYAHQARLRLADLNADGHLDIVLGYDGSGKWLPGDGAGGFGAAQFLPYRSTGGVSPQPMAIASLDSDPADDLIFATGWSIDLALNPGTSLDSSRTDAGHAGNGVAAGDFDEDGATDVVSASFVNWDLLRGNGDGSLQPPVTIGPGGQSLFVADFDLDGHLDVMCGGVMYAGAGDGSFVAGAGLGFDPAAVTDLDGDGWSDAIRFGAASVEVRFGDGPFSFGPPEAWTTGLDPFDLAIDDLDGDGRADLVVSCSGAPPIATVLPGIAPRGFARPPAFAVGAAPVAIAAGEFTGDGHTDLITANVGARTLTVLPGLGDLSFSAPVPYAAPAGVRALRVTDLDGDGRLDVITAADSAGTVSVCMGLAGGGFSARVDYVIGGGPSRLATGDWDGDGKDDLVIADPDGRRVLWMKGDGNGVFATPVVIGGGKAREAAMLDVNHDGNTDVVYNTLESSSLSPNQHVLFGDGAGGLIAQSPGVLGSGGGIRSWFAVGDVTSDGWPELVVATRHDSMQTVRSWVWTPGHSSGDVDSVSPSVTGVRVADVDGDGHLDALSTSDHANTVTVRFGRGDGTFGPRYEHLAGDGAADLVAADFDGDGDLDAAVANARANTVSVLENLSAPTTDAPRPGATTAAFALHGASPNPARGALRVSFTLPDDRPARLEVWDVAGRRVAARDVGALGTGAHHVEIHGVHLPPGVYLLRLFRADAALQRRVAIIR